MISASGEVGVSVMVELCQRVDGKEMLDEWQASVLVPIFKGKMLEIAILTEE